MTAVIFDVGNVLIEWDVKALYRKLLPDDDAIDAFLDETGLLALNVELDRGLSFAEGIGELATLYPHRAELLYAFKDRWRETVIGQIDGSVEILNALRAADIPTYAITNFSAETWPVAVERFSFLATHFLDVVVSGQIGVIKPDPDIYLTLMKRNGLSPDTCVFIDDSEANVSGARAVGMKAFQFFDPASLRRDLAECGILPMLPSHQ